MRGRAWLAMPLCMATVFPVATAQTAQTAQMAQTAQATQDTHAAQRARIERLLNAVERSEGLRFERNGTRVNAADAVRFLRAKWARMAPQVGIPEAFIEQVASRSSTSGQAYRVCTGAAPNETACSDAGPWLKALLKRLEASQTPSP